MSSRQSLNVAPSPVPSALDDEEAAGDEEMMAYIRRQQAKKMANGASQKELDDLLSFPEPLTPAVARTPQGKPFLLSLVLHIINCTVDILRSDQAKYLSQYERNEILDETEIYYFGAKSNKKLATMENTRNNHGYDDDRGDYLVVNHDHLKYRYEVIDTLGKGSFGQVLQCRDHCTGLSVAVKIIRNKKRFHHQALVEVKILENLKKWVSPLATALSYIG